MTDNLSLLLGSDFETVEGVGDISSLYINTAMRWYWQWYLVALVHLLLFHPLLSGYFETIWYLITTVHPVVLFPKYFITFYILEGLEE